jgi:hypothetical protein
MAIKVNSITYQCWKTYGIEDGDMQDGVCPICASELYEGEKPEFYTNVGAHIVHCHADFVQEHGIMRHTKKEVVPKTKNHDSKQENENKNQDPKQENEIGMAKDIKKFDNTLATKVAVLKSVLGCNDKFFENKKILDVDVYITPRRDGDIVHVQMNYIDNNIKEGNE